MITFSYDYSEVHKTMKEKQFRELTRYLWTGVEYNKPKVLEELIKLLKDLSDLPKVKKEVLIKIIEIYYQWGIPELVKKYFEMYKETINN